MKGDIININATITNYNNQPTSFMIVFYDGDSNIGSQNTPVLQPLETINVSMDYKLEHASEHIITIKIYTEDGETLLEKNSFTLIVNTQKTTPPNTPPDIILISIIIVFLITAASVIMWKKRSKTLSKIKSRSEEEESEEASEEKKKETDEEEEYL